MGLLGALLPAGIGLLGSVLGIGQQSRAAGAASNAASQAAAGQTAIDQQLAQIYNSLFQNYQQNYQPATPAIGQNVQGLAGAAGGASGALTQLIQLLTNPQALEAATGIPQTQAQQGAFNYFGQPGNTQAQAAGAAALPTFTNPSSLPSVAGLGQLAGIDLSTLTGLGPASNAQSTGLNTTTGAAGGLNALASGGPVNQQLPSTLNYLNNTGGTNLAGATPAVMALLGQTMQQGIDPKIISQLLQQQDVASQSAISDVRNQLGGALPNLAGTVKDITGQEFAGNANLLSQLGAQSQNLKLAAGQQALSAAGGLDAQTQQMLTAALQSAGYGEQQIASILSSVGGLGGQQAGIGSAMTSTALAPLSTTSALSSQAQTSTQDILNSLGLGVQTGGTLDAQTAQMLMSALGIGQNAQSSLTGNLGTAVSTGTGVDSLVQSILNAAMGPVNTATSGLQGIGQQYAQAGQGAAYNAQQASQQNPFGSLATTLAGIKWPTTAATPAPPVPAAPATTGYNPNQFNYLQAQGPY